MGLKKEIGRILERWMIKDLRKKLLKLVERNIKKNQIIIDLGCGKKGSLDYNKLKKQISLFGYEREKESLKEFLSKYNNMDVKFQQLDIDKKGKMKERGDLVISSGVIQYLNHPENLFNLAYNSLNNTGVFIITTVNQNNWLRRLKIVSKKLKHSEKRIYTIKELKEFLKKNKFGIWRIIGSDFIWLPKKLCNNIIIVTKKCQT